LITKATSLTTLPITLCQVILSQNHLLVNKPHEGFDS
jgi:hypothetical protein